MSLFPDLSKRYLQGEIMDDPELDDQARHQALAALRRINYVSGSVFFPRLYENFNILSGEREKERDRY